MSSTITVLVTSAGRRVELLRCFRRDASDLGLQIDILAADVNPELSAGCHEADAAFKLSFAHSPEYPEQVLELCRNHGVNLVVPTIDPELLPLSLLGSRLMQAGTWVAIGEPDAIRITIDKLRTHQFLLRIGIPCPKTVLSNESADPISEPVILKPRYGSASQGVFKLQNFGALDRSKLADDYLLQEFVNGTEYTVNAYIAKLGTVHCVIPHRRLEVRSGEVSKALTVRHHRLTEYAQVIARSLPLIGPICFQAIDTGDNDPKVLEINARFGGGYPVAHQAGGRFTRYLIEQTLGREPTLCGEWRSDLLMLRYDAAIYVEK